MNKALIFIAFAGLFVSACKKEIAFEVPQVEDFTGKYSVSGTVETTTPTKTSTAFSMSSGVDSASGSTCELIPNYSYSNQQTYRLTSSMLRENLRARWFEALFFAGATTPSEPINQWTLAELDSVFKVGKKLPFGTNFGQVGIEFVDVLSAPVVRRYESLAADNTGNFVLIEKVEDAKNIFDGTFDASPWVKFVTFSFGCKMGVPNGEPAPDIELKDCRATMLIKPYVK